MNPLRLTPRIAPALLALALLSFPFSVRAAENTPAPEDAAAKAKAAHDEILKQALAKYDANGNGRLDESELAKMKADAAARDAKYKQALAKYDANHNGKLDPEELAKMKEDEIIAAKVERQQAKSDLHDARVMQRAQVRGQGKGRKF